MKTEIKLFDTKNKDNDNNGQTLDFDLSGLQFLPRIGENIFLHEISIPYVVTEIQHAFKKESDYETDHLINIHLK
jgi:hypothetical protein